jgi:hypothetical protein
MFTEQHSSSDNTARTEVIRHVAIVVFALVGLFLIAEPLLRRVSSSPKPTLLPVAQASQAVPRLKTKPIETIQPGEKVWACDPTTGAWSAREVLQRFEHDYNGDMVALTVAGERIEATGNHPFWVVSGDGLDSRPAAQHVPAAEQQLAWMSGKGRWVDARHLQPGDVLLIRNGQMATVEQTQARQAEQKVYNLQVADVHTYAVTDAGVVVHNRMPPEPGVGWGAPTSPPSVPAPRPPGPTVDPVTGELVGRFIGTRNGPAMIEPVGGRTVAAGQGGVDTHTLYPNGANYQRLNPFGHGSNPTPHAHGHAPGTGPFMSGQGPSLDTSGNIVPWNSPDAHWPYP